jgi:transposase
MSVKRRSFRKPFKREAVDRIASSGPSAGAVARKLGLHETVLRRWMMQHGAQATGPARRPHTQAPAPSPSDLAAENAACVARTTTCGWSETSKKAALSLLRLQEYGNVDRKCVLTETATGFSIKHMHRIPPHLFAWVRPEHLRLTAADTATLEADGYDMKAWKSGKLLTVNERFPSPTQEQIAADIMKAISNNLRVGPD